MTAKTAQTFFVPIVVSVFISAFTVMTGCSSHPIKPEGENVKVSRSDAGKDCKELGPVEGRVASAKGTFEQALEDLKTDAARKGANFVKIEQTSGTGTAVRGISYFCD
ncbi:MAG: DUF4156 domain-containing protein [Bdellovibrionales bacterium]|jgi:hypothetical protein|nr:DUF4156 domain-containing protein [Bdellovibrionales bacterium]